MRVCCCGRTNLQPHLVLTRHDTDRAAVSIMQAIVARHWWSFVPRKARSNCATTVPISERRCIFAWCSNGTLYTSHQQPPTGKV